jgi:hypothetical protein
VTEDRYWLDLEYRLCREFSGLPERRYHYFWCDGFIPDEYVLDDPRPRVTGRVWICNGPNQDLWNFALLLPAKVDSRETINWASLLPADDVTCWMCFDEQQKYLEIDPAVAKPDLR